jgi:hypothetical protein
MAVDEQRALAELKRRIGALPDDLVVSGDVDAAFRRFLVARKWDLDKAEEQLRATLKWRSDEFRLQKFLVRRALVLVGKPPPLTSLSAQANPPLARLALVRTLLPANPHLGFSKQGWPVTLINVGGSDPARAGKELSGDDLVRGYLVSTACRAAGAASSAEGGRDIRYTGRRPRGESRVLPGSGVSRGDQARGCVHRSAPQLFISPYHFIEHKHTPGRLIDKEVVLLDFGGMSLSLLKLKTIFGTMNSIGSRYFPERTVLFFILNAPGIFSMMWNVVKGLVDPRTQKKINILSSGSRQIEGVSLVWSSDY